MLPIVRRLVITFLVLAACATACTDDATSTGAGPSRSASGNVNCVDAEQNPAEELAQPEVEQTTPSGANVVLQVTNSAPQPVHVTVEIDGQVAVDSRLPAAQHAGCIGGPVYHWYYSLPVGHVTLTATREAEPTESLSFRVAPKRRWIVIDAQEGFPLEPQLWTEEPQWG